MNSCGPLPVAVRPVSVKNPSSATSPIISSGRLLPLGHDQLSMTAADQVTTVFYRRHVGFALDGMPSGEPPRHRRAHRNQREASQLIMVGADADSVLGAPAQAGACQPSIAKGIADVVKRPAGIRARIHHPAVDAAF
jgi:hypothetical protein